MERYNHKNAYCIIKKSLFIMILLIFHLFSYAPPLCPEYQKIQIDNYLRREYQKKCTELYEKVINHIKEVEGLELSPYLCPAGQLTIGYGHMILKNEKYHFITVQTADSILRTDFNEKLALIDEKLEYNQRLALAHFIYNLGEGRYYKSTLKKLVDSQRIIDDEIKKYCFYRNNGKLIKSQYLYKSRCFELEIYNNKLIKYETKSFSQIN